MPNAHKVPTVTVRLSAELYRWLKAYAVSEGVPVNRVVVEALEAVRYAAWRQGRGD